MTWKEAKAISRECSVTGPNVFVVVRASGWDKDDYLFAYERREDAEQCASHFNGEPYDADELQDFRVWTIPVGPDYWKIPG